MPCVSHPSRVRGLKLTPDYIVQWFLSHPSRVRGLKLLCGCKVVAKRKVAPLAGAWIETPSTQTCCRRLLWSHPSRVRGLKLLRQIELSEAPGSHPSRVRGLKQRNSAGDSHRRQSHPSRVRGLKQPFVTPPQIISTSHPSRVRGLKHIAKHSCHARYVAPLAGAWIETTSSRGRSSACRSHPSRVRGLKLARSSRAVRGPGGRTPRGCVD